MFVGCLIGFQRWLVVNLTGSKCGKGKLIEAFVIALSLQLYVSLPQMQIAESLYFVVVELSAETQWLLWFLNHKKSVGVWLSILFRVICFKNNLNTGGKLRLTRRLRRIHNAWRFQFKLDLVFKVQWFKFSG